MFIIIGPEFQCLKGKGRNINVLKGMMVEFQCLKGQGRNCKFLKGQGRNSSG